MKTSSLVRESVKLLDPPSYRSIPANVTRMNDNSNLFMPNPVVKRSVSSFDFDSLSMYPSVFSDELRQAIGRKFGISWSQTIVGNGSDELIDLAVKTFIEPKDTIVVPSPTFEMYGMYGKIAGASTVECMLRRSSFQLDADLILSSDAKMIFISSPNNPTGNSFDRKDILRIAQESDAVVVVDEAYADFCDSPSLVDMTRKLSNLLVLRTFSKAYALPGLRVGFCMGSSDVIDPMTKACAPFRLNRFAEKVAIDALSDDGFVKEVSAMAKQEREWVAKALEKLGAKTYPSVANFILFKSPIPAKSLVQKMMAENIAIRDCSDRPMLENCVRVTIGNRKVNERFVSAIEKVLGGAK